MVLQFSLRHNSSAYIKFIPIALVFVGEICMVHRVGAGLLACSLGENTEPPWDSETMCMSDDWCALN